MERGWIVRGLIMSAMQKQNLKYSYGYSYIGDLLRDKTTIQVDRKTLQILDIVKRKYKAPSYDKTILRLTEKEIKVPKSMFGAYPNLKKFVRDENDFHEL